jgi:hypothetical protein
VDTGGTITTVAGNGSYGFAGDNGPATSASLAYPVGVAVDAAGKLYIADSNNHRIRRVGESDSVPPLTTGVLLSLNPVAINTPVTLTATVDDSTTGGLNISGASYSLDAGGPVAMAAQDGAFDSPIEDVTAVLGPFAAAGVYRPCVQGTDSAHNTGVGVCTMLAVYDPAAGFISGGGWISSPAGAHPAEPGLAGKASVGFVSRYKRGATVPKGEMEFEYEAQDSTAHAHFHFRSSAYEWLVLSGGFAQFIGRGRIEGIAGNYGFLVTAVDGQVNGSGGVDLFRIKIWNRATGTVFYDNEMSTPDYSWPATSLGDGSIEVKK